MGRIFYGDILHTKFKNGTRYSERNSRYCQGEKQQINPKQANLAKKLGCFIIVGIFLDALLGN